jgi:superkiller protein 3
VKARLDKLEEAIEDYSKAIEYLSDSNYSYQARFNKGICLRKIGKLEQSIDILKEAV